MKIRKVVANDRKPLANFLIDYWKQRGMKFLIPWTLQYLKKGMAFEMSEERLICTDGRSILGTIAILKYYERVAEIRDEVWNDDKTGSLLLARLIQYAKKEKIKKLYSMALDNKVAFYRRHGFKKEGVLRNHFKDEEDITIMSKFL